MAASSESSAEQRLRRISQLVDKMLPAQRRALASSASAQKSAGAAFGPLYEAAALLSIFDPAQPPFSGNFGDLDELRLLLADSTAATSAGGRRRSLRTLAAEVRCAVLRQLRTSGRLLQVLDATALSRAKPDREGDDTLQIALTAYLKGNALPVFEQTLDQLTASYQVCQWLRQAGFPSLPEEAEFRQRADRLSLLRTFEHLVGTHFRGRIAEVQRLRDYVGVLPPATLLSTAKRFLSDVFSLYQKPPLMVYGPGGVGKSTLLSFFLLEHAKAADRHRFPFIYLDFDRTDIDPGTPISLLLESLRQLGIEYPESRQGCERIASDCRSQIEILQTQSHTQSSEADTAGSQNRVLQGAVADFSSLINTLGAADQPVVMVLDTFEEVQVRSDEQVQAIWNLLNDIQSKTPRLRVVIAGRSELPAHLPTDAMLLDDLDEEAATGYLQARGVKDEKVARRIVQQVGRTPLTLQLAADLYAKEGTTVRGELDVITTGPRYLIFSAKLTQGQIQRHLYKRVLGHIKNEDVKKLAHPGLILRRITPELILEVLAAPCGLKNVKTPPEATALFEQLRREVSLVSADDGSGTLRHRPDLRRLMVGLLREDEPAKVTAIHRSAVSYYEKRPPAPMERAEEIYHRLCLDEDRGVIGNRWLPQVESYLAGALGEFAGARRAFLASRLHLVVDAETLQQAGQEDWEKLTEQKVRSRLANEDYQGALAEMSARSERSPSSALYSLEATAFAKLRRWNEALAVLQRGLRQACLTEVPDWSLSVALTSQAADLVLMGQLIADVPAVAEDLRDMRQGTPPGAQRLLLLAKEIAILAIGNTVGSDSGNSLRAELRAEFDATVDEELQKDPQLPLWIQLVLEPEDAPRLARLLRLGGLPAGNQQSLIQLSHLVGSIQHFGGLESMAIPRSSNDGLENFAPQSAAPPDAGGMLENARIQILNAAYLSAEVSSTTRAQAAQALSLWLEALDEPLPPNVMGGFNRLAQTSLGIDVSGTPTRGPSQVSGSTTFSKGLSGPLMSRLVNAIADTFSQDELRLVMRMGLDRSLESLVNLNQPFRVIVFDLLSAADREGWLLPLITHLSEARPGRPDFNTAVEEITGAPVISVHRNAKNFGGPNQVEFLARVKSQICRLEVGGQFTGTGFLVAPDLVLTALDQSAKLGAAAFASHEVQVRFDQRVDREGNILSTGITFPARRGDPLAQRVLGIERGIRFGYVLLGITDSPGIQPLSQINVQGPRRGWIQVPLSSSPWQQSGSSIAVLSCQKAGPMIFSLCKLSGVAGPDGIISYNEALDTDAAYDSPGGAVFDSALDLAGLNLGQGPQAWLSCISMEAILRDLQNQKLDHLLRATDEKP